MSQSVDPPSSLEALTQAPLIPESVVTIDTIGSAYEIQENFFDAVRLWLGYDTPGKAIHFTVVKRYEFVREGDRERVIERLATGRDVGADLLTDNSVTVLWIGERPMAYAIRLRDGYNCTITTFGLNTNFADDCRWQDRLGPGYE